MPAAIWLFRVSRSAVDAFTGEAQQGHQVIVHLPGIGQDRHVAYRGAGAFHARLLQLRIVRMLRAQRQAEAQFRGMQRDGGELPGAPIAT